MQCRMFRSIARGIREEPGRCRGISLIVCHVARLAVGSCDSRLAASLFACDLFENIVRNLRGMLGSGCCVVRKVAEVKVCASARAP